MKKLQHKGFTLIESLLVIIALCLVVGVSYYVYNSVHNTSDTTTTPVNKQYLVIKELGIKFELTPMLKNAYYAKVGNNYYFSVHDFDSNSELSSCNVDSATGHLGILALLVGKVGENNGTPSGGVWTQSALDASGMQKVGDTYYGFQSGNAPCFDPTTADAQTNAQTISDYKHAFVVQQSTFTKI